MSEQIIRFRKDGKIYEAQKGKTIENKTDNKSTGISVQEIAHRGENRYGLLFFGKHTVWGSEIEVENLDDFEE